MSAYYTLRVLTNFVRAIGKDAVVALYCFTTKTVEQRWLNFSRALVCSSKIRGTAMQALRQLGRHSLQATLALGKLAHGQRTYATNPDAQGQFSQCVAASTQSCKPASVPFDAPMPIMRALMSGEAESKRGSVSHGTVRHFPRCPAMIA